MKAFVIGIVMVVIAAAAGIGGYMYGTNTATAQAAAARSRFFADRGGVPGGTPGAAGQGNFNPANFANGTVKSISGNTIQLSTAQNVLTVTISDQTQIRKQVTGTTADITTGERITIQGQTNSDGTMTAQTIQIGGGFGRQGGGGGQSQGQPAPATAP